MIKHAITLRPELAWAMLELERGCDTRDFHPGPLVGTTIALHAGAHVGGRPGNPAMRAGLQRLADGMYRAGIPGVVVDLAGTKAPALAYALPGDERGVLLPGASLVTSAIVGVAYLRQICRRGDVAPPDPWCEDTILSSHEAAGDEVYWWVFDTVTVLKTPIPCSGARGVWALPQAVADAVEEAVERVAIQEEC